MTAFTPEPQLAPPGAGLPLPELLVARVLFALRRATGNRQSFTAHFKNERARIRLHVDGVDREGASRRVLIARCRGLEDSSRFWSILMVLDHLRIVHNGISRTIRLLAAGKAPPGAASTAAVKPSPAVTEQVVGEYEKSCDDLLGTVESVKDLNTPLRYRHPWFGALNAAGWHALSATHLSIHRLQIERIMDGLRKIEHESPPKTPVRV